MESTIVRWNAMLSIIWDMLFIWSMFDISESISLCDLWSFYRQRTLFKEFIAFQSIIILASWHLIEEFILEIIQVSLPNGGDSTISSMNKLFCIMKPRLQSFNLWQVCLWTFSNNFYKPNFIPSQVHLLFCTNSS